MTVADTAAFLRVSESLVRRLIREKRIPFFQIDGRYLFYRPALEEWVQSKTVRPDGDSTAETAARTADGVWNGKEVR